MSYRQQPLARRFVAVRTAGDTAAAMRAIRSGVSAVDRNLPVARLHTVADLMTAAVAAPRFRTTLVTIFAVAGVLLAALGIYGVMAFFVSERASELAVRVALGATRRDVMTLVLREALVLAAIGVTLGVVGALGATRFMASLLFGIAPTNDIWTYTATAAVLVGMALVGSYVPARRAARTDPIDALRSE